MDKKTKNDKNIKKGNKKRIAVVICAVVLAITFLLSCLYPLIMTASANAVDDAKAARDKAKRELDGIKSRKADLVQEFAGFDAQLTAVEGQINALNDSIDETEELIAQKQLELEEAIENTDAYKEEFKQRARIMYENGSTSYLEVLFGASSFGDFIGRLEIISSIVSYDHEVLDKYIENQHIIENSKAEQEALLARQMEDRQSLSYRQEELEITLQKKQAIIDALSEDENLAAKAYAAAEKKYEEEERKAQEEIRRKNATTTYSGTYSGGKFAWPAPSSGRITSPYGYRIHPISGVRRLHRGIDIGAAYGTDVIAAEDGVVTIAKYNGSYGNYIVINHGNGYTTLYAHNSRLLVSAGQRVSRGQVIAKVGSTGDSTGPHCHFEVSYNGALQNPLNYLR